MQVTSISFLEMSDAVERDASGLPRAWPLLHEGDNVVTRSHGMPVNLRLSRDDLAGIVEYHRAKGVKIPIDSEHVVSNLAGRLKMDEAELLRRLPRYCGVAGFGRLELRGDTLFLADAEYLDIGREALKAGQFRYFSPTLRGLDGQSPLRVTSVALTNSPHLQHIPALTAGETNEEREDEAATPETVAAAIARLTNPKEAEMPEEVKKETAAAPTPAPAPETPAKAPETQTPSAEADAELLKLIREVLGEDVTAENLKARLAALKATADGTAALSAKVEQLEAAEEARKLAAVRTDALAHGKLTPAMLQKPYFQSMTAAELSDYCANVADGCAAPVGVLEMGGDASRTSAPAAPKRYASVREAIAAAEVTNMKGF